MPKRKVKTEEEILKEEKERGLLDIREKLHLINEPTYKFNIGDKVQYGALKESIVKEILYDNKVYVLDCIKTEENYGKPYDHKIIRVCAWHDIRPINSNNTIFTKNEDIQLTFYNSDIKSLICKYYNFGIDMNPYYQRDYVWSDKDKESLLDSIFNNIDIGKFVLIYLDIEEWVKKGFGYEILDGKQRLNTLIEFYENRFPYKGKYYNDLSSKDKRTFNNVHIPVAEIQNVNKNDILKYFIMLNTTGKTMDKNHIDKIKNMIGE